MHPDENNNRIASILDELGVYYERERSFAGLSGEKGRPLRFDFYVPSRPQLCIEYQGAQHFPCGYGLTRPGGVTDMLRQVKHDALKRTWCENKLIPLLTILPGLSVDTERALLRESLDFWRCYEERVRMSEEDRGPVAEEEDARFNVHAAKRARRALNVAPLHLNFCV